MPIFEFHCNKCEKNFEYLVIGKDKPICPTCNNKDVYKLMSVCGFVSKGGSSGEVTKTSASSTSCSGCTASSCSSCGN